MKEEKEKLERELQEMRKEKESLEENFASIKRVVDDGGVGSATKEGGGGRLGDHSSGGDVLEPACTNNEGEVVTLMLYPRRRRHSYQLGFYRSELSV